ncbi:Fur-regulated basic protein FbpA [Metabacillus fastidiosus]|uniref:Fur-regulated basic protein FbpA n=1 Tax=Metabacillus fastidiosus TaxID=1458 RepID=A0ABU6NTQ0_9BACI|nr:Fur-regulated basic protein FbpA [Metabacillus fastidiosus]MEC2076702.1 Fur-regulated basic protein FbpA [Metabacillus fastidiosus]MED4400527.1 Fur-regulated basic protein FbpA [Metabacillus fastidiosus]MED4455752.1 Fur-regulated basic protein FbpA [Metabacillus fastidiosus]MED4464579.1 Fur-regulated basic protein FbpA [Metabacillus fastidiosus]MED4534290.1 Fur-regulated basic protein FbpA [Metabacillus fastidiosus]
MRKVFKNNILSRKELIIEQLLELKSYKSSDNRQLYELTLSELEYEYEKLCDKY